MSRSMFIKTDTGKDWVNLSACRHVEIDVDNNQIILRLAVVGTGIRATFVIKETSNKPFETEDEMTETLNSIWRAYRDGECVWPPESIS